jgi:hypothetical protein
MYRDYVKQFPKNAGDIDTNLLINVSILHV